MPVDDIALAEFDNHLDEHVTTARLLNLAGYPASAAAVRNCGKLHRCKLRSCPHYKPQWKRRNVTKVLDGITSTGADDIVCMVLTTVGESAAEATGQHLDSWGRFCKAARFPVHGAFHLTRKVVGGRWDWLAHHHTFIGRHDVGAARAEWANVARRPAKVEAIRTTLEQAVGYVVKGAVLVPAVQADAIAWFRATRGLQLVTTRKGRPALKREHRQTCSTVRTFPRESLIRRRIMRHVRSGPQSPSRLRKRFAQHERFTVHEVTERMVQAGELWRVRTSRGHQLMATDFFDDV